MIVSVAGIIYEFDPMIVGWHVSTISLCSIYSTYYYGSFGVLSFDVSWWDLVRPMQLARALHCHLFMYRIFITQFN